MEEHLSLKQLKENLRDVLRNSGALSVVKSQIRREFIKSAGLAKGNQLLSKTSRYTSNLAGNLHERVIYSLLYHALYQRNLSNSLSVFIAEFGYDAKSFLLSEIDIISSLQLGSTSPVYKVIMTKELSSPDSTDMKSASLLDYLVDHTFSNINRKEEISTQTDDSGYSAMELVDMQMKDIRKVYLKQRDEERLKPMRSVEERMLIFERECEDRYRRDLEIQVAFIRDNEAAKLRLDERQLARQEIEALKRDMASDYQHRLESHQHRELELNRRNEEKERHFQQMLYDARQKMQQEIDDLRNREQLVSRKVELETQGLQVLELRVKEAQAYLESREHELSRRERDVDVKLKDMMKQSKEDARLHLRQEMEAVMKDRSMLIIDRQKFEEEKGYNTALIENANGARHQVHDLQQQLLMKDDELASYKRRFEQTEARRADELDMKGKPGYSTNIVTLIHRNAELEAMLRERDDNNIIVKNEEIQRLTLKMRELEMESVIERKNLSKENDLSRQEMQMERMRANALDAKCHELEKQNLEYKNLLSKLQGLGLGSRSDGSRFSNNIDHAKKISEMVEGVIARQPMRQNSTFRDSRQNLNPPKGDGLSYQSSSRDHEPPIMSQQSVASLAAMLSPYLQAQVSHPNYPMNPYLHPQYVPPMGLQPYATQPQLMYQQSQPYIAQSTQGSMAATSTVVPSIASSQPTHLMSTESSPIVNQRSNPTENISASSMNIQAIDPQPLPIQPPHVERLYTTLQESPTLISILPISQPSVPVNRESTPATQSSPIIHSIPNKDDTAATTRILSPSTTTAMDSAQPAAIQDTVLISESTTQTSASKTTSYRHEAAKVEASEPVEFSIPELATPPASQAAASSAEDPPPQHISIPPSKSQSESNINSESKDDADEYYQEFDTPEEFEPSISAYEPDILPSTAPEKEHVPQADQALTAAESTNQALLDEQRRQEEDRFAILEAKRRVLERRNKKLGRDSSESLMTATSMDDNPSARASWNQPVSSIPSSTQSSHADFQQDDMIEAISVDEEFEAAADSENSDSSNGGWF